MRRHRIRSVHFDVEIFGLVDRSRRCNHEPAILGDAIKPNDPGCRRIASLLGRVKDLEATADSLVEQLGPAVDCGWLALWKAQSDTETLRVFSTWQSLSIRAGDFEKFTRRWQPSFGEGMVGEAWRSSRPQSTSNIVQDMVLPRSLYAKGAGLVEGLWIPIRIRKSGFVLECLWSAAPGQALPKRMEQLARGMIAFLDHR